MEPEEQLLYDYALCFVGLPYRWGGDDTVDGFDCSGLVLELMAAVGYRPGDLSAAQLWNLGLPTSKPVIGTLAFFGSGAVTHVGLCLDAHHMIEAGGGGSKTLTREDASKQNAYVRIRPVTNRKDFLGFRNPPYPWLDTQAIL